MNTSDNNINNNSIDEYWQSVLNESDDNTDDASEKKSIFYKIKINKFFKLIWISKKIL